jgi:hypothetical protein
MRIVTARRNKMASRRPSQFVGSRLVSAMIARSNDPGAKAPKGIVAETGMRVIVGRPNYRRTCIFTLAQGWQLHRLPA